jgi:hypothetical protein
MGDLTTVAKWVVVIGIGIVLLGGALWVVGRLGLPVGRLPGDIRVERPGFSLYMPCATSIILSLVLTVALNVIARLINR